jgi:hypothetical protein
MRVATAAFTLLEICLALAIGMMLVLLAVPSVSGLLAEQRLKRSFERFDHLVAAATARSVAEQRAYALVWENHGVRLVPVEPADPAQSGHEADSTPDFVGMSKPDELELQLPTTLSRRALGQWTFWSNGTCEPATIAFHGAEGNWLVRYDPLTTHGTFVQSSIR